MSYEDAKDYAADMARRSGVGLVAVLLISIIFYRQSAPDGLTIAVCVLAGFVLYEGVQMFLISSLIRQRPAAQAETYEVLPMVELEPVTSLPEPLAKVIDSPWAEETNWVGLFRYVQKGDAALSRAAVNGLVDQRFYSPRDGEESFPELMVAIGAAARVTNGGGLPSYIWSPTAAQVLYDLAVQGRVHAGWRPLSPTVAE